MSTSADYDVPRPSRIKLKETKAEIASRLYRREQRYQAKLSERISRANGLDPSASSSSSSRRHDSASPPRRRTGGPARNGRGSTRTGDSVQDDDEDEIVEVHYDPLTRERTESRVPAGGARPPRRRQPHRADSLSSDGSGGERSRREWDRGRGHDHVRAQRFFADETDVVNPFSSFDALPPDIRIPSRFRHAAGNAFADAFDHTAHASSTFFGRDPYAEVRLFGGPIPSLGNMSADEYTRFVRQGMFARRNQSELDERRQRQQERELRDIEEEEQRRRRAEREQRQADKQERQRDREWRQARQRSAEAEMAHRADLRSASAQAGRDRATKERERYRTRWKALLDTGGDIEMVDLTFADIPWPVYAPSPSSSPTQAVSITDLEYSRVETFLYALADDQAATNGDSDARAARKVVLREAIKAFHPDRFFGRILPRVREADRDMVKEGVERCSRLINELASKL